jgi:hypothetical protein
MPFAEESTMPSDKRQDLGAPSNKERILLGGFFESYEDAYAEAWWRLMPNREGLALPILYLQRHTFELLVKGILESSIAERSTLHDLDELFGTASGPGPANPTDLELAHTSHKFKELFPRLKANLSALGRSLPSEFAELEKLFCEVDEDRPDRLRYATLFSKKRSDRSFPTVFDKRPRKYAPCSEVAEPLTRILEAKRLALKAVVESEPPPESALGRFFLREYEACEEVEAAVRARLGPIATATRDGDIHWIEVPTSCLRLDDHPALKDMAKEVHKNCLETEFRNRRLNILVFEEAISVRGTSGDRLENAFFLAARRPNGTLTAGLWPDDSQSNLMHEVRQAYRRDRPQA